MDGEERTGSKLKGFFDPSEIDPDTPKKSSPGTGMTQSVDKDDSADEAIPF